MILNGLKDSDIQDKRVSKINLAKVIYYRLMIARLGEEDNNFWWESRILSTVGRLNMVPFLPKTFYQQRFDMVQKAVRQKEINSIPANKVITLFHFGFEFEKKVFEPALKMLSSRKEWEDVLLEVEKIQNISFEKHWARDFFEEPRLETFSDASGEAFEIGSKRRHFYIHNEELEEVIHNFISGYDYASRGHIPIPYYKRVAVD